jgi:PAS domain S-box-containing protein
LRVKSGEIKTALISMEVVDVDGQPCILSIIKDITDRKKVEEALRVSEECFSKAFMASPIMVCISYIEDGRFIDVNDSFCKAIGSGREEVMGKTSLDINIWNTPDDREEVVRLIKANGSVRDLEYHFRIKSGDMRLGSYSGEAITINGKPCLLSILSDITDRRRMESEMTRMDRLEMVGRMAAVIGHEIRNP